MRGMRDMRNMIGMMLALGAMGEGCMFNEEKQKYPTKRQRPLKMTTPPKKIIPKGCQEYTFEDGFTCIASSQKVADKKHEKHLSHE
jgi:hypothetical protein